ncbi:MAG: hypothetical protein P8X67_08485 [Syntrophobacterales bacterium]
MKVHINSCFSFGTVIGIVVLLFLATSSEIYAQGQGNAGIPAVVEQLETISTKLTEIQTRLTALEVTNLRQVGQLTVLEDELIPCSPEKYRAGLCGEGETPFDLAISLCASAGGDAKIEGKFAFDSKTSVQGGAGWKEVLDVDATVEAGMPGVIFPFGPTVPIPLVLPSELAVGGGVHAGTDLGGCIEVGKIPIGLFVPRARILAMLDKIDQSQDQLVTLLVDTFDSPSQGIQTFNSQTASSLDPSALVTSIQAARSFSERDFESDDPFDVVFDPDLRAFGEALPLGGRLQRLLEDPGMMVPDIDPFNPEVCERLQNAPTIGPKVANICGFFQNDLPSFQVVSDAFGLIDQMNGNILDFPNTIDYIVSDLLPDIPTPSPPLPSGSPFCQRFPRLCPF